MLIADFAGARARRIGASREIPSGELISGGGRMLDSCGVDAVDYGKSLCIHWGNYC